MNIFYLDKDPVLAAQYHCDKHIVKMPIEAAQMICTVLISKGHQSKPTKSIVWAANTIGYKATHMNHPCTRWAKESDENLQWLWFHFDALCDEYTRRYEKMHLVEAKMIQIRHLCPMNVDFSAHTKPALAIPEKYKQDDPVLAYRAFYKAEKSRFAKWSKAYNTPYWW